MADVNVQYIEMLDSLFIKESADSLLNDQYTHFRKYSELDPCFFQWRNLDCICGADGNIIYGIRNNHSKLRRIYNYLISYMFRLPKCNYYDVSILPENYWYSSGKNNIRGYF